MEKQNNDIQVIISDPAVVLYIHGKKFVAKCHPEDKFNEQVGLMMCFAKAFGVNFHKIQELLKTAIRYPRVSPDVPEEFETTEKIAYVGITDRPVRTEMEECAIESLYDADDAQEKHEKLYVIKSIKGRSKGKYVTDYCYDNLKVKYGEVPFTFATKRRANCFIKKFGLENITSLELIDIAELEKNF
ncbi:MAG: hypothetical protein J6J36_06895 [Clostridia bacterium]|nr:hypothetical protein [Clostridia bacterium]